MAKKKVVKELDWSDILTKAIIPFSNQLVKAAAEAQVAGKTRRKKPSKKAVKTLEKYLKVNGSAPVVHTPKKRGRPPKVKVTAKKRSPKKRKK
jgi:hypothetical protein